MSIDELLEQAGIDVTALSPAPASPTGQQVRTRITAQRPHSCAVCGKAGAMARVLETDQGARWPDLCTGHGTAVLDPSPRMPVTTAGILADLSAALAQTARPRRAGHRACGCEPMSPAGRQAG